MASQNLSKKAYTAIKEKIIYCKYAPGSMINEQRICDDLGFSRTPIREAVNRLEQDRFVNVIPKKGIHVTDIHMGDIAQIYQVRMEIEPLTVRMATEHLSEAKLLDFRAQFAAEDPDTVSSYRLDTAMHLFIIEHCGNEYIIDMMEKVFEKNTRVIIASNQDKIKVHEARQEHMQILDALLARDSEEAALLMQRHLEGCRRSAFDYFSGFAFAQSNRTAYLNYLNA